MAAESTVADNWDNSGLGFEKFKPDNHHCHHDKDQAAYQHIAHGRTALSPTGLNGRLDDPDAIFLSHWILAGQATSEAASTLERASCSRASALYSLRPHRVSKLRNCCEELRPFVSVPYCSLKAIRTCPTQLPATGAPECEIQAIRPKKTLQPMACFIHQPHPQNSQKTASARAEH